MSVLDFDHWREIWQALKGNKVRTLLTAFGVFWGIFLLMVMMGTGNGLENGALEGFGQGATNSVFIWGQRATKPFRGLPVGRPISLTNEDTAAVRAQVPEAKLVVSRVQLGGFMGGNNVTRGTKSGGFNVNGDWPEIDLAWHVPIVEGRFLNKLDMEGHRKVAVIGSRVREVLFRPEEKAIGQDIRINGVYFTVIGTFKPQSTGGQGDREAQTIHIPFTTFQQSFNYGNRVDWLAVTSADNVPAAKAEERVMSILRARHTVAPDDRRAFGSFNLEEEFKQFQGLFIGIRALIWIVGTGTLAAGVIGVSNIMLVIVRERTHEIGIRRSLGATPANISGQVILEALLLTAVAGYCGLLLGMLLMDVISAQISASPSQFFKNPGVGIATAFKALVILVVSGVAAGLMPAWRAIRIKTVEALRTA